MFEDSLRLTSSGKHDCSDGHSWGTGVRNVYVWHLVIKGKGFFESGGKKYNVSAGQIFAIYPNIPVHYFPDMSDPFEYIWVDFCGEMADMLVKSTAFSPKSPISPLLDVDVAENLFENCRRALFKFSGVSPQLLELFSYIIKAMPANSEQKDKSNAEKAAEYIRNNLHKAGLCIDEIAQYCTISRTQLYRIFMCKYGISPVQYITAQRIKKAKKLLKNTDLSVNAVSYSVGYSDPLYFSYAFKRKNGLSPQNFRNKK